MLILNSQFIPFLPFPVVGYQCICYFKINYVSNHQGNKNQNCFTSYHCFPCVFVWVYCEMSEKAMAPHSSTLVWKIPWTEEPGRL